MLNRRIRRFQGAGAAAIAMLTVGIGLTSALWALATRVVDQQVRAADARDLLFVSTRDSQGSLHGVSQEEYERLREASQDSLELIGVARDTCVIGNGSGTRPIFGEAVTRNYGAVFAPALQLGRFLDPGASDEVVISDRLWRVGFDARSDVVGKSLSVFSRGRLLGAYDPKPITRVVVGVLKAEFVGLGTPWEPTDYLVDVRAETSRALDGSSSPVRVSMIAALHEGVGPAAATSMLRSLSTHIAGQGEDLVVAQRREGRLPFDLAGSASPEHVGWTLEVLAMSVYLVTLFNVATIYLASELAREREVGVQLALGASIRRLARDAVFRLSRDVAIAAIGGIWVGHLICDGLLATVPAEALGVSPFSLPLRWQDIGVGLSAAVAALIVVGLSVTSRLWRLNPSRLLLSHGIFQTSRVSPRRLYAALCVPQLTLSAVFVILSTGFVHGEWIAARTGLGYNTRQMAVVAFELPESQGATSASPDDQLAVRVLDELSVHPGTAATFAGFLPWRTAHGALVQQSTGVTIEHVARQEFRGDYIGTLGLKVLEGQPLGQADSLDRALISASLATRLSPSPIGQRIGFRTADSVPPKWLVVSGVVNDVVSPTDAQQEQPIVYTRASAQAATRYLLTSSDEGAVKAGAQAALVLLASAPSVHIVSQLPADSLVDRLRFQQQAVTTLLAASCIASLTFTAAALFAVTSYVTRKRRREFGLRLALGSTRSGVLRLVLITTGRVAVIATLIAIPAVFLAHSWLSATIPNNPPLDFEGLWSSPLLMASVVVLAAWIPARQASRVDPNELLRDA